MQNESSLVKRPIPDDAGPALTIEHKGRTITYRWRSHAADQWVGWQRKTPEGWSAITDPELIALLDR